MDSAEGVRLSSGVAVTLAVLVGIGAGASVELGSAVRRGMEIGRAVGEKIRFAMGSPNKADATVEENNTSARINHCQPASMYVLRVR